MGRFEGEFVEERRRALELFLHRVLAHPGLRNQSVVLLFINGSETELASAKTGKKGSMVDEVFSSSSNNNGASSAAPAKKKGFLSFMKSGLESVQNALHVSKEREKTTDDIACDQVMAYANELEQQLTSLHAHAQNLITSDRALSKTWFDLGLACTVLGQAETAQLQQQKLAAGPHAAEKGIAHDAHLAKALAQVGTIADQLSMIISKKSEQENLIFREPLKDYIRLADSVKAMMKTRAQVLSAYHAALNTLDAR